MTRKQPNLTPPSHSSAAIIPRSRHRRRTKPRRTTADDYSDEVCRPQSLIQSIDAGSDQPEIEYDDVSSNITGSGSTDDIPVLGAADGSSGFSGFQGYVNIAPLPVFGGGSGECPVRHLSRFVKVCRANNADSVEMMMRIFPVTLDHEAALWYDLNIEPYISSLSWEDIKSSFIDAYGGTEPPELLRHDLTTIHQGRDESVRSYFLRLQLILSKIPDNGLPDSVLNAIFTDGLSDCLRDEVVRQRPRTLNEALSLACGFEHWRRRRSGGSDSESGGNKTGEREDVSEKSECRCSKHRCWEKCDPQEYKT